MSRRDLLAMCGCYALTAMLGALVLCPELIWRLL